MIDLVMSGKKEELRAERGGEAEPPEIASLPKFSLMDDRHTGNGYGVWRRNLSADALRL